MIAAHLSPVASHSPCKRIRDMIMRTILTHVNSSPLQLTPALLFLYATLYQVQTSTTHTVPFSRRFWRKSEISRIIDLLYMIIILILESDPG